MFVIVPTVKVSVIEASSEITKPSAVITPLELISPEAVIIPVNVISYPSIFVFEVALPIVIFCPELPVPIVIPLVVFELSILNVPVESKDILVPSTVKVPSISTF